MAMGGKGSYVVCVCDVPAKYGPTYFPRKFKYKKEAVECAKRAIAEGASFARVECPGMGEIDFRPEKSKMLVRKSSKRKLRLGDTVKNVPITEVSLEEEKPTLLEQATPFARNAKRLGVKLTPIYCPDCGQKTLRLIEVTEENIDGEFKEIRTCDYADCDTLVYIIRKGKDDEEPNCDD